MVSINTLLPLIVSLSSSVLSFQLLHDQDGYAILPPTDKVLEHLKQVGKQDSSEHYDVLTTVHSNGEIIQVNLHSHEINQTGKYKYDYDNSAYNDESKRDLFTRTIEDADLKQCFNKEFELESSQCGFDFISYDNATDCDSSSTKYSCVLDVMKQQDATLKLKDMDDVPAQVRCYHKLSTAQKDEVIGGACGK
ncbi:hypothetical protein KGF54_004568 [Candida jiufengensis]|uniref:uncharacterized protein n=1 Tax=Candida jiufengensis TaxID=497108 RepID=UPI0022243C20|nr:uncharacterized protein KGF54_004568 [Candida jiufengensis]KAI5951494.1 hypothetical protein KGF54_004568 [Candida jiufengensis]